MPALMCARTLRNVLPNAPTHTLPGTKRVPTPYPPRIMAKKLVKSKGRQRNLMLVTALPLTSAVKGDALVFGKLLERHANIFRTLFEKILKAGTRFFHVQRHSHRLYGTD